MFNASFHALSRHFRALPARLAAALFLTAACAALPVSMVWAYTNDDSPFGINAHIYGESDAAGMEELGVRWTRCDFNWDIIEPNGKGSFSWGTFDALVTAAHNHSLNVLAIVGYSPNWATSYPGDPANPDIGDDGKPEDPSKWPPSNNEDYKDFVKAVVERYDGDGVDDMAGSLTVKYFELWNEADIGFFQGTAAEYAEMMIAGYEGLKEANPNAKALMSGLSRGGKDRDFTEQMLAAMFAATDTVAFDIQNNHSYAGPDAAPDLIQRHRNAFLGYGIDLPYWFTEGSVSVDDPDNESKILDQVAGVPKWYARFLANDVDKFFWYMWQFSATDFHEGFFWGAPPEIYGEKKPGYYAYKTMVELIQPRYFDASLTQLTMELEQYGFSDPTGATSAVYLLWSADDQPHDLRLAFPAPALELIAATGGVSILTPAEDNFFDLTVTDMPFYLREKDLDLNGPPVRSPASNATISDNHPRIEWDKYSGALSYIVQLSQVSSFPAGSTTEFNLIYGLNYLIQDALADGQWHARAIAVKPDQSQAYGPTVPFVVDTAPPPPPDVKSFSPLTSYLGGSIRIEFNSFADSDPVQINIYRSESLDDLGDRPHSTVKISSGDFTDALGSGIENRLFYYRFTTLDAAEPPNESEPTDIHMMFYKMETPISPGWNLMSFPGAPQIVVAYSPAINYFPGVIRTDGGYEAYDGNAEFIDPTRPYWIYYNRTVGENASASGPVINPPETVEFSLAAGWNLVPNPYPAALAWDDYDHAAIRLSGETAVKTLSYASTNGYMRPEVFYYENGAYAIVDNNAGQSIPPFRSFWVQAYQAIDLVISIP